MISEFHKPTFLNIPESKRDHVFTTAVSEFARHGYAATSINQVAKKAGISIGSMYSYFSSKEDLFLAIVYKGYQLLEAALQTLPDGLPLRGQIAWLLQTAVLYAQKHPDMTKLYLSMMTEELAPLAERLSIQVEGITVGFYRRLLQDAVHNAQARADLDIPMAALMVDNLVVMLQLSCACTYHQYRLSQFLDGRAQDQQAVIAALTDLIMRSLT